MKASILAKSFLVEFRDGVKLGTQPKLQQKSCFKAVVKLLRSRPKAKNVVCVTKTDLEKMAD
jgi:hypothetical protein